MRCWFNPWVGKIPWSRKWQPSPVFFPGESHGQRILQGYSPWGHKESDTTQQRAYMHTHTHGVKSLSLDTQDAYLDRYQHIKVNVKPPPQKKNPKVNVIQ